MKEQEEKMSEYTKELRRRRAAIKIQSCARGLLQRMRDERRQGRGPLLPGGKMPAHFARARGTRQGWGHGSLDSNTALMAGQAVIETVNANTKPKKHPELDTERLSTPGIGISPSLR